MGNGIDTSGEQYQHFLYLKEILEQKKSIDEFSKWVKALSNILERNKLSLNDYLKLINFKVNDENLTNEFFASLPQKLEKWENGPLLGD